MSDREPHARAESALEILILADFMIKLPHHNRQWMNNALVLHDRLTVPEREYLLSLQAQVNDKTPPLSRLDESMTPFACLASLAFRSKEGDGLPADPVAAFRDRVGAVKANYDFRNIGVMKLLHFCRLWRTRYYGVIQRAASARGLQAVAPPSDGQALPVLRYLLAAASVFPQYGFGAEMHVAYTLLSEDEARVLLEMCIDLHNAGLLEGEYVFKRSPERMAALCPEVLSNHHTMLLDAKYPAQGPVYRIATNEIRDRLIREAPGHALWIGDEAVRAAMRDRRQKISEGKVSAPYYGWELRTDGGRRDLGTQECFYLRARKDPSTPLAPDVVRVMTDHESTCAACDRRLVSVFDINVSDPRMAFLSRGEDGTPADAAPKRLRIAACEQCVRGAYETAGMIFTRVDLQGKSEVLPNPAGRPRKEAIDPYATQPRDVLAMEASPCSPVALECQAILGHSSAIGGLPHWEQGPDYPKCPECKRSMPFVGQVDEMSLNSGDGVMYAHVCRRCWIATVVYQAT